RPASSALFLLPEYPYGCNTPYTVALVSYSPSSLWNSRGSMGTRASASTAKTRAPGLSLAALWGGHADRIVVRVRVAVGAIIEPGRVRARPTPQPAGVEPVA